MTPPLVQASVPPMVLEGVVDVKEYKVDVCASAVTGSGKTAAF